MPKSGHTEEQIVAVLRQVEAGAHVDDLCRKIGISQATYYLWKRKYTGVGVSELRELRQLRDEVGRLKRLVADLSLDRQILQEIVPKSCKASCASEVGTLGARGLSNQRAARGQAGEAGDRDAEISEAEGVR